MIQNNRCFGQIKFAIKPDVARGTAGEDFIFALFRDPAFFVHVIIGKRTWIERDGNRLFFSRLEKNFLETLQFLDWPGHAGINRLHINLRNFRARAFAGVGEIKFHRRGIFGIAVLRELQLRIFEVV